MTERRSRISILALAITLVTGCEKPTADPSAPPMELPSTNSTDLAHSLRARNAQERAAAAKWIADTSAAIPSRDLIRALDDPNPVVRRYCAVALGRRREEAAIKPLFRLLQDDDWFVRAEAAAALGNIGDPRAAGWLVQLLNDGDAYVRLCAATALRDVVGPSNRALLLQAFARAEPAVRKEIAIALARLAEMQSLDVLIVAGMTNDVATRRRVAEALGDYPLPAVTNALATLMTDKDPVVRQAAGRAFEKVQRSPKP